MSPIESADAGHLEDFLALVAHEVNTPLSIVSAASQTALENYDQLDRDQHRQLLDAIDRNARLAILLMERMQLARDIEENAVRLDLEQVDLAELIRRSVDDLSLVLLEAHPMEVELPSSYELAADPTAVREVVFNLLSNAVKYSPPGTPIRITLHEDGEHAVVDIFNHGKGIIPGDTDAIFDKYTQGESVSRGVGLGLFISRGLARAHGGDITVRSAEEVGSEFRLELPNGAHGGAPQPCDPRPDVP